MSLQKTFWRFWGPVLGLLATTSALSAAQSANAVEFFETPIHSIENPVHPNEIQVTVLHQLGLDHKRLSFRHSGRDFGLADIKGTW